MYNLVNGFILNRTNFSEYDKIATIYTLQFGKIKVLFKSINKITAKFISFIEPATELELQVVKLKNKNYGTIFKFAGGKVVNFNEQLRLNLEIYKYTCKILDFIDAMTFDFVKDDNKFFLIKRIFEFLPFSKNLYIIYLAFVFRFIKLCGYMPELNRCIKCKEKFINSTSYFYFFNFVNKGIICHNCEKDINNSEKIKISSVAIKILQKFYKLNAEQIDSLQISKDILEEISKLVFIYIQNYIHRPLKISL